MKLPNEIRETVAPMKVALPWNHVFRRCFHRSVGIVGLPNVGKSTLFNALTKTQQAQAANYPFCTIEPNIARVSVPDERLQRLSALVGSLKTIESQLEFVDIAGLVKGASQGEGLGNKFLENIRQVDVIAHMLRCYEDIDILHVEEGVDPLRDLAIIRSELLLADLNTIEKRLLSASKKARNGDQESQDWVQLLDLLLKALEEGIPASSVEIPEEFKSFYNQLHLLTAKKSLFICNVSEDDAVEGNHMTQEVIQLANEENSACMLVSASLEEAASSFDTQENQLEYLSMCGLKETGLSQVIRACNSLLQLQSFYTVGPMEARSWSIPQGTPAPIAAGVIHSDFERLFIRAETISYDDFVRAGSESKAKEQGLMRIEGKEYICQDGDIFHFLIGK